MPNTATHLGQAHHNEQFFLCFDRRVYSDWAATTIFYAALHYIDAFLAHVGISDPGGHDVRDDLVATRPELVPVSRDYFRLKSRSRNARYYARRFPLQEIDTCRNTYLENIRNHIQGLIP